MINTLKFLAIIALVMTLFSVSSTPAFAVPNPATTQDCKGASTDGIDPGDFADNGSFVQSLLTAQTTASQDKVNAYQTGLNSVPPLDVQAAYCLQKLVAVFNQIATASDTGSIFDLVLGAIMSQVTAALTAVCTAALSEISSLEKAALSYINVCMPLPSLNVSLKFGTGLTAKPCNGTPLLKVGLTPVGQLTPGQIGVPNEIYKLFGIQP